MTLVIPLEKIEPNDSRLVGGKAASLARLISGGMSVPQGICITTTAYRQFVDVTGLRTRIGLELSRKSPSEMRWEEIWDASLRIRNLFITTPFPTRLERDLTKRLASFLNGAPVAVRSSAIGEDAKTASFAGLHSSYLNVKGLDSVLDHIRMVWASLWSDAALLYRNELGLDVSRSAMAVIVQHLIAGERSGVAFGVSPHDDAAMVIEAVYGLNEGMVDGSVEPDRWILDRRTGAIRSFSPATRAHAVRPTDNGVTLVPLSDTERTSPPITDDDAVRLAGILRASERVFGSPQDMEWTMRGDEIIVLQSRPVTTAGSKEDGDKRPWYLSLRRSYDSLAALRKRIEGDLIPALLDTVNALKARDLSGLSPSELLEELAHRAEIHQKWIAVYWNDFIPFAHGMRLFGMYYNDTVRPADPYEFMDLLVAVPLQSTRRNLMLSQMAEMVRRDPRLFEESSSASKVPGEFSSLLQTFLETFGDLFCTATQCVQGPEAVLRLVREMASMPPAPAERILKNSETLTETYLSASPPEKREFAAGLLDLAKASYRLRDDDNIYLGMLRAEVTRVAEECRTRCGNDERIAQRVNEILATLTDLNPLGKGRTEQTVTESSRSLRARQLTGQPAGPGIARGPAHIIADPAEILSFKKGEVLVCDAIDPSFTFIVPLAVGIVERRGGMLIHGAIIAREYGIPCVTGIPDATSLIHDGDMVTVDGFLGIVTVE